MRKNRNQAKGNVQSMPQDNHRPAEGPCGGIRQLRPQHVEDLADKHAGHGHRHQPDIAHHVREGADSGQEG